MHLAKYTFTFTPIFNSFKKEKHFVHFLEMIISVQYKEFFY